MPSILLVRHGQASFGASDYDRLSALGEQQATIVADAVTRRDLTVERVISGSLRRQRDTAAPLAATLGQEVEVDERWDEYAMEAIIAAHSPFRSAPDTGAGAKPLSSQDFQDILETGLSGWIASGRDSSAAESWPAFSQRVHAALGELAVTLASGTTAVVFTSGGVIAAVCAGLLDGPETQLLPINRVAVNTGITKVVAGRRALSLISFNDHAHLEGGAPGLITYR